MSDPAQMPPAIGGAEEIRPFLLYCTDGSQASFALWRLTSGEQALAIFATSEAAAQYRLELVEHEAWRSFQPTREKLIEICTASLEAGIRLAALNPAGGGARTLFDLAQVVAAAKTQQA